MFVHEPVRARRGGGRPLPAGERARMGASFGMDLGAVRVHTDRQADALNQALSAEASTVGHDIYFREGAYRPGTPRGLRLLAHELTHVAQQGGGRGSSLSVGAPHTAAEHEAEAVGERVAAGGTVDAAAVTAVAPGLVQRRYLDAASNQQGYRDWIQDTTVRKGLTTFSREALRPVDDLLAQVLASPPGSVVARLLPELDTALAQTRYDQVGLRKTTSTFRKRKLAVYRMRLEIHHLMPPASHAGVRPPRRRAQIAALEPVGFPDGYLESLPRDDLLLLYEADRALTERNMRRAQEMLDALTRPLAYAEDETKDAFPGWSEEKYKTAGTPGVGFDFAREREELMDAQRALITFHAAHIGGDYAALLTYKPYKADPLDPVAVARAKQYLNGNQVHGWSSINKTGVELQEAIDRAPGVAAASTKASRDKGRQKPGQKAPLTAEEVTALRLYAGTAYRQMNAAFRDFRVDDPTANWGKYSAIAKLAISGLGKLPKARMPSYRGEYVENARNPALLRPLLRQGATLRLPSFYSATAVPGRAFGGAVGYVFDNKRGGRLIQDFAVLGGEAEVLIPPGTAFRVKERFELQKDDTWLDADGGVGLTGDVAKFAEQEGDGKGRMIYLEMDEIRPPSALA